MTLTGLLVLAAAAAAGYALGRPRRSDPQRFGAGRDQPVRRFRLVPLLGVLGLVMVLSWLAPGPGFGPDGLFGPHGLFGVGEWFDGPGPRGPGR